MSVNIGFYLHVNASDGDSAAAVLFYQDKKGLNRYYNKGCGWKSWIREKPTATVTMTHFAHCEILHGNYKLSD